MLYHITYHYTTALHINHLIFLHTLLFGMMLSVSAAGVWELTVAVVALFVAYICLLFTARRSLLALPYCLFVSLLATSAWIVREELSRGFRPWQILLVGLGIVLTSFAVQLYGHAKYEEFEAPPNLWHGFVAAPILEYTSFLFRLGALTEMKEMVMKEAEAARAEARATKEARTTGEMTLND